MHGPGRLGTKIRVWRLDINYYVLQNPNAVIPEENLQLMLFRTKTLLTDGPIYNYGSFFNVWVAGSNLQ